MFHRHAEFADHLRKLVDLQCAIADIDDPWVELTLGRMCATVSRVTHLLRVQGAALSPVLLEEFDRTSAAFIARVLGGDMLEHSSNQAALGLRAAGVLEVAERAVPEQGTGGEDDDERWRHEGRELAADRPARQPARARDELGADRAR